MKAIVKRPSIVLLISAVCAVLIFNSGGATHPAIAQTPPATQSAAIPSTKPTVTAKISGLEIPGADGSLCWPGADGQPVCTMVDEPKLNAPTNVSDGDTITFTVDPASPPPAQLVAKLLDDPDSSGDPTQVDLVPTNGDFKVTGLKDGNHRIEVDVVYPADSAGNQPYVSYVYVIELGSAATSEATEAATGAATEAPTVVAPTQEGTLATTVPPTATTEAPTATTVAPTATTVAPTAAILTATPTFTLTVGPTVTVAAPTATGAVVTATSGAAQSVTPPTLSATVEGQTYTPIGITTCLSGACQSMPLDASAPRISAAAGSTAQFAFAGTRPDAVAIVLLNADATTQVSKASVSPDNAQYTLPVNAGNYVVAVNLTLGTTTVTYYYRLSIGS